MGKSSRGGGLAAFRIDSDSLLTKNGFTYSGSVKIAYETVKPL